MISDLINQAATLIKTSQNTTAFTGAGISTPSGIPDFRSPESGLWEQVDPIEVASIYGFRRNPQAFYDWVHPLARLTLKAQPNPAHMALAALEAQGYLTAIITQNIDMLHTRAGNTLVYELHGHMREATCTHCFRVYPAEPIMRKFIADGQVPVCPDENCRGVIKPNVILFGEQLPYQALQGAKDAAKATDLMLIIGSSLEVAPASDMPILAQRSGARLVIINKDETEMDNRADMVIRGDAAEILPAIVQQIETL